MRSGYAFGAICYKKCELEYRRCKHIFHAEKYILTLLCLSTHTYTHPRAHTHTYIFNINLVCQVILKSSERDILYDFHLNDCIIYFISCDSDEFFVIPFNAFCRSYNFHCGCGRVDIRLRCWYCSVYNSVEGGQTFVISKI